MTGRQTDRESELEELRKKKGELDSNIESKERDKDKKINRER